VTDDTHTLAKAVASVLAEPEEREIILNSLRARLAAAGLRSLCCSRAVVARGANNEHVMFFNGLSHRCMAAGAPS
jgi:hypothetical protein